jgi:hypothetical protein
LFDTGREVDLLAAMVREGPLVDGRSHQRTAAVDGIDSVQYTGVLPKLERIVAAK